MLELIILGLATWRISYMLVAEQGPYDIFEKLRHKVGVQYLEDGTPFSHSMWGALFTCVWCISVEVGTILYIAEALTGVIWFAIPFAISTVGIIINEGIAWLVHQSTRS